MIVYIIKDTRTLLLTALILSAICDYCECSQNLNKCCSADEQFDENLKCSKTRKNGASIAISNRLAIDKSYDKFNFTAKVGVIPCRGRQFIVKSFDWVDLDENGTLMLYDDFNDIVANYSKASYCVERWNIDEKEIQDIAYLCPCLEHLCIWKCCNPGRQIFTIRDKSGKIISNDCLPYNTSRGERDWDYSLLNPSFEGVYNETLVSSVNCGDRYTLSLTGTYNLQTDGGIRSEFDGIIQSGDYCGDYMYSENGIERLGAVLACVLDNPRPVAQLVFYAVLTTISVIFLLITIVLHIWLPELAGLHGRCLVVHTSCLLLGHILTTINQFSKIPNLHYTCYILGYLMQFSFLASFFWLNIMCVDMSYTFSAIRPTSKGSQRERDRRKFIWYSMYAWGGTLAFTLAALIVDFTPGIPASSPYKPNLGDIKCWFKSTEALLLYFYGPMGVLLVANLVLFIYTTWRIVIMSRGSDRLHQGDSARHGGPSNREKQRYILYAKMFSLMGVTWLTEIISWAVGGPSYIWYVTDSINVLRAVFIFIIFCWKPRVWVAVRRKYSHVRCSVMKKLGKVITAEDIQAAEHSEPSTASTESAKGQDAKMELNPKN